MILTSCGFNPIDASDGIPFIYYDNFTYEGISYDIFEVEKIYLIDTNERVNQVIKYDIQEIKKEDVFLTDEWIINYQQDYDYQMGLINVEKEVINKMYEEIEDSIKKFEGILNISLEYSPEERLIEREFVVDKNKEFTSVLLVDLLIPYRLVNNQTNQTNIIYIPVKSSLCYLNNEIVELIFDDVVIKMNYGDFINLSNPEY
jgi:hypothetical protein